MKKATRVGHALEAPEGDVALAPALAGVTGYLLRRAHGAYQAYWMARFKTADTPVTPVQAGMLVVLDANPGLTQIGLARMMNVEGATLMQSIDRLEHHGYLRRIRRPTDRRSYQLQLTARGDAALAAIKAFLPERDDDLLADLTPEEVEQLGRLLTKVVARAHLRLKELQDPPARSRDT
jgi:DNA-binding MarR family transcriptional regulator